MTDLAFITDGTAAVVGMLLGLVDMGVNYCPEGCLARRDMVPYASLSVGDTVFQGESVAQEFYIRREVGHAYGPFQMAYGLSSTTDGELWAGIGHVHTMATPDQHWFLQTHSMVGLYEEGGGRDLGGPIEFRSGVEAGYQTDEGIRVSLGVDHRSNAGLYSDNPGLETVHLRLSIPTKAMAK